MRTCREKNSLRIPRMQSPESMASWLQETCKYTEIREHTDFITASIYFFFPDHFQMNFDLLRFSLRCLISFVFIVPYCAGTLMPWRKDSVFWRPKEAHVDGWGPDLLSILTRSVSPQMLCKFVLGMKLLTRDASRRIKMSCVTTCFMMAEYHKTMKEIMCLTHWLQLCFSDHMLATWKDLNYLELLVCQIVEGISWYQMLLVHKQMSEWCNDVRMTKLADEDNIFETYFWHII